VILSFGQLLLTLYRINRPLNTVQGFLATQ
jgi:hypothetical protein